MPKYIKCPRCELNYILETEKLCPVCQAELKLSKDDSLSEDMELCPICGQNFVSYDQPMCDECAKKRSLDDIVDEDDNDEDGYERTSIDSFNDIDSAADDEVEIPFADLDEDDEDEDDDENEDSAVDSADYDDFEEDFDYDVDDVDDFDDEDDEDDDEFDDDDEF